MLTDVSSMKCFHGVANHAWRQSCMRQSLQFPNLGLPIPRRRRCGTGTCRHDTFTFNLTGAAMPLALRRVCNMQGAALVVVVVVKVAPVPGRHGGGQRTAGVAAFAVFFLCFFFSLLLLRSGLRVVESDQGAMCQWCASASRARVAFIAQEGGPGARGEEATA